MPSDWTDDIMKAESYRKSEHMNKTEKRKIQWHPAFCSAVQLVFKKEPVHLFWEHLSGKPQET